MLTNDDKEWLLTLADTLFYHLISSSDLDYKKISIESFRRALDEIRTTPQEEK